MTSSDLQPRPDGARRTQPRRPLWSAPMCVPLLAQMDRFKDMGRNFRGERAAVSSSDLWALAAVAALIVAVVFVLYFSLDRRDRQRKRNSPHGLFRELCKAHDLTRAERRLLESVAARRHLADPGQLFVRPELLEAEPGKPANAERLALAQALAAKLFGRPADPPHVEQTAAAAP